MTTLFQVGRLRVHNLASRGREPPEDRRISGGSRPRRTGVSPGAHAPGSLSASYASLLRGAPAADIRVDMAAVAIEHVTKIFGSHVAVDDLSLQVPAGT